jgi:hypothetical protein
LNKSILIFVPYDPALFHVFSVLLFVIPIKEFLIFSESRVMYLPESMTDRVLEQRLMASILLRLGNAGMTASSL